MKRKSATVAATCALLCFQAGSASVTAAAPAGKPQPAMSVHAAKPDAAFQAGPQVLTTVWYDYVDSEGNLVGGRTMLPVSQPPARAQAGETDNRIIVTIVGDGYTAAEMDIYATHAGRTANAFFSREPYTSYRPLFSVHRVDVISQESGVDNDPTQGIYRNTAMDMGFWCNGMERLLCVSTSKAWSYASTVPGTDLVFAIANSTKYGGAGYPNLSTVSGNNSLSADVAVHESGHSFGNLADEYDYGGGPTYTGSEPGEPNISKLTASQMAAAGTKWAAWLGTTDSLFDNPVSCFEGADYCLYGIYRPSYNSMMRALDRPFNGPSAEALIIGIYRHVRPIDDATPNTGTLQGTETVFVDPVDPVSHALSIQWFIDAAPIPGATQQTISLWPLGLGAGAHELSVKVSDGTPWVRNESARATWMTQTMTWSVFSPAHVPDFDGDRDVDQDDFGSFQACLTGSGGTQNAPACVYARLDSDSDVDSGDLTLFRRCMYGPGVQVPDNCLNPN